MSAAREWAVRLGAMFKKDAAQRLDEELQAHAQMLADEYVARGMSAAEAARVARRELGNVTAVREEYRERSGLPLVENFWLDLKYAFRTLRRNRAYAAACITTLAVGLGSMVTVLGVVSTLLVKPLPYPQAKNLMAIKEVDPRQGWWPFSQPTLVDLAERSRLLSVVAAYRHDNLVLTGMGEPESILSAAVTPSLFQLTGTTATLGKVLSGAEPYVFISREFWRRKWAMDPQVVGRSIKLGGQSYTVAGIGDLPDDLLPGVELLLPLTPQASESRTAHEVDVVAGIKSGAGAGQAQAELNTIVARIDRENAKTNAGWGLRLMPLSDFLNGPIAGSVWMILAAVALLWVLACANVAGLQIARSVARKHEIGTRLALGASRARLVSQTLTESLVLAVAGSGVGVVLAVFATDGIRQWGSAFFPRLMKLQMDGSVVLIAMACMVVSAVISGLLSARAPAYRAGREIDRRDKGRDVLIVAQVALVSILLVGATLLFQSFARLRAVNPGFDPDRVLSVRIDSSEARRKLMGEATERLSELPGVESVGASNVTPFSGEGTANRFRLDDEAQGEYHSAAWRAVTPGYFETLGVRLKRGRLFTEADRDGSLEVVIVSEAMARQYWGNEDPVGRRLLWGKSESPKVVVGVVGDLRDLAVNAAAAPTMFRPFRQLSDAPMTLLIRTKGDPALAIPSIRRQMAAIDHDAALECKPLRQAMADSILRPRASLMAVAGFASVALLTAAFGLYGLITYRVNQRQQEIGIRLALGAPRGSVRWSVQKRCLGLVCGGAALGLPLAFVLSKLMTSLLYETAPTQPVVYAMDFAIFVGVGLFASLGPAMRASWLDPAAAIRHE